jgi:thiol-disulfide isomerase/thioredoxin
MRTLLSTSLSLLLTGPVFSETPVETQVNAIIEEYNSGVRERILQIQKATTQEERTAIRQSMPRIELYTPRVLAVAEQHTGDPGAVKAVCWLATQAASTPEATRALELLGTHYAASPGVWEAAQNLHRLPRAQSEPLLRAIREKNPSAQDRCAATHSLATQLFIHSEGLQTPEAKAWREEAASLFEEVMTKHADITINGFKPAMQAAGMMFELRHLQPGGEAPEIEGKDGDGATFKLTDYRGRNVLLVFWGSWCHSCHSFLPQLQALAEKLKDRPFAIVGVNSDILAEYQAHRAQHPTPWRNFCDESSSGPISTLWNIRHWPTLYLIDAKGIIAAKQPALGEIESLLNSGSIAQSQSGLPGKAGGL